ncbi:hypothetical protein Tco_1397992 [Tanacetum coccineum]
MTTLQFADTHNLVAFLAKPAESEGFKQVATVKVKTVNGEQQLQALVDEKKIVVTEGSIKRDLQLDDEEGTDCLPNATIFEELTRIGQGKDFFGRETPIFPSMVVQAQEEMGEGSAMPTDPHHTPIITQPSLSQPQSKQKSRRPKEKDTQAPQSSVPSDLTNIADEAVHEEPSMQLKKLMDFCTKLQQRVLDMENTKTAQA